MKVLNNEHYLRKEGNGMNMVIKRAASLTVALLFIFSTVFFLSLEEIHASCLYSSDTDVVNKPINDSQVSEYVTMKEITRETVKEIGQFKATAYCHCAYCCGSSGNLTANGTWPEQGRTIAVDPDVIPLGTEVYIEYNGEKHKYIAEDTGSAINGNVIDIFYESHTDALEWGVRYVTVYI